MNSQKKENLKNLLKEDIYTFLDNWHDDINISEEVCNVVDNLAEAAVDFMIENKELEDRDDSVVFYGNMDEFGDF